MGKNQYDDWREQHGAKLDALEAFGSGTADVLRGTVKQYSAHMPIH